VEREVLRPPVRPAGVQEPLLEGLGREAEGRKEEDAPSFEEARRSPAVVRGAFGRPPPGAHRADRGHSSVFSPCCALFSKSLPGAAALRTSSYIFRASSLRPAAR